MTENCKKKKIKTTWPVSVTLGSETPPGKICWSDLVKAREIQDYGR